MARSASEQDRPGRTGPWDWLLRWFRRGNAPAASGTLRIATRASRLALWQANHVRDLLRERHPGLEVELVEITSTGDVVRDRPLYQVGGVGIFTKEVQDALLDGRADLAVHSLKDLPTEPHPQLELAAVPAREVEHDVLLAPRHRTLANLPSGAKVATSSLRRRAQLLAGRPDLEIVDIRGNVETRIRKLHDEELDGLVLAAAGIRRLGLDHEVTENLPAEIVLPAVGQGALGLECRRGDMRTGNLLRPLEDADTRCRVEAERAFLGVLQGGCQVPVGTRTWFADELLYLEGIVLDPSGSPSVRLGAAAPRHEAPQLGERLARQAIAEGADVILAKLRGEQPDSTGRGTV